MTTPHPQDAKAPFAELKRSGSEWIIWLNGRPCFREAEEETGITWVNMINASFRDRCRPLVEALDRTKSALEMLKSEGWKTPIEQLMYAGNPSVRKANEALVEARKALEEFNGK